MASTPVINSNDRQATPSAPASRRCTTCGELMKGHGNLPQGFCAQVRDLKANIWQASESLSGDSLGAPGSSMIKLEGNQGLSISEGPRGLSSTPKSRLPTIAEAEAIDFSRHSDSAMIILPVSSQPELVSPFAPILEMRTILQLKSLELSSFHTTKKGDWGFVVTGGSEAMREWVVENRVSAQWRMKGKPSRYHSAVVLVLGLLTGAITMLWVILGIASRR